MRKASVYHPKLGAYTECFRLRHSWAAKYNEFREFDSLECCRSIMGNLIFMLGVATVFAIAIIVFRLFARKNRVNYGLFCGIGIICIPWLSIEKYIFSMYLDCQTRPDIGTSDRAGCMESRISAMFVLAAIAFIVLASFLMVVFALRKRDINKQLS